MKVLIKTPNPVAVNLELYFEQLECLLTRVVLKINKNPFYLQ